MGEKYEPLSACLFYSLGHIEKNEKGAAKEKTPLLSMLHRICLSSTTVNSLHLLRIHPNFLPDKLLKHNTAASPARQYIASH